MFLFVQIPRRDSISSSLVVPVFLSLLNSTNSTNVSSLVIPEFTGELPQLNQTISTNNSYRNVDIIMKAQAAGHQIIEKSVTKWSDRTSGLRQDPKWKNQGRNATPTRLRKHVPGWKMAKNWTCSGSLRFPVFLCVFCVTLSNITVNWQCRIDSADFRPNRKKKRN